MQTGNYISIGAFRWNSQPCFMYQLTKLPLVSVLISEVVMNLKGDDYSTDMQLNSRAVITEEG